MKILYEKPPAHLWDRLEKTFGVRFEDVVVTYGENVYAIGPFPADIEAHEAVHVRQQTEFRGGPDEWWNWYLSHPEFRYEQELEAYREQWRFIQRHVKDRNAAMRHLHRISRDLSGMTYGHVVSFEEAMCAIRSA